MKTVLSLLLFFVFTAAFSQSYVTRDIKSFGAKGNGITNDHDAFIKAAEFFNKRGGNGKLLIPKGLYLVGKQVFNKNTKAKPVYEGQDLLHLRKVNNFTIEGSLGNLIKYKDSMRFGAFEPATGKAHLHGSNYFVDPPFKAQPGIAITIDSSSNVRIINVNLHGNAQNLSKGGVYGDVGIQLEHTGIYISNSKNVTVDKVSVVHFGLDGITIANAPSKNTELDGMIVTNSRFEYNGRQGLSWTGGNDLTVSNSKFNHTGMGSLYSPPGAGVDIEAEVGPVKNGKFENCEFINNKGCGLVAHSGTSSDCTFIKCTFWGTQTWSMWVQKPGFTFTSCNIFGSMVHGYNSSTDADATKYIRCLFEDRPYKNKEPFGNFLIETNHARRVRFENCIMLAHKQKIFWMESRGDFKAAEKYQIINCTLSYTGNNLPDKDFVCLLRGVTYKNSTFVITDPHAKNKGYYFNNYPSEYNVDLGGNKFIIR